MKLGWAEDRAHFGNLGEQLAAGDDQRASPAPLFQVGQLEDRVDRLLTRLVDEGARVDDEAVGRLGLLRDLLAYPGSMPSTSSEST